MSIRHKHLSDREIRAAFDGGGIPPILTSLEAAQVLRVSPKTLDEWVSRGRLDGAYRRVGKHRRFWRDRLIQVVFNGPEWK